MTFSVANRLMFSYAGIFTLSSLLAFAIFYYAIASIIYTRSNHELLEDITELSELLQEEGESELKDEFEAEAESEGAEKVFYRLIGADNQVLFSTDLSHWPDLLSPQELRQTLAKTDEPLVKSQTFPGHDHATRSIAGFVGQGQIMEIGQSYADDDEFLQAFQNIFTVTVPLVMLIAACVGWFMARKSLQGVREVTQAALAISKGNLSRRVPVSNRGDDIDRLADTFNLMLDRIQALISGMQDMTDNIAHDLRSPLARIRGIAETTLLNNPSNEDYKIVAGNVIEECDRLLHMINTMLDITETEAGTLKSKLSKINLSEIVGNACDLYQPLAEDKGVRFECESAQDIVVNGSVPSLQRLIGNILDNAMKFTPAGGKINLKLHRNGNTALVEVKDSGIGIAEKEKQKIFKRFYRCDQSRSKSGIGLGLSLAMAIVRAHGGDITVESELNKGSLFKILLPMPV